MGVSVSHSLGGDLWGGEVGPGTPHRAEGSLWVTGWGETCGGWWGPSWGTHSSEGYQHGGLCSFGHWGSSILLFFWGGGVIFWWLWGGSQLFWGGVLFP